MEEFMKKIISLFVLSIFFSTGCMNPLLGEYYAYKTGYTQILPGQTTDLSVNGLFFIEIDENGSIPYQWNYAIDSKVQFIDDKTFDLDEAGPAGRSMNHIWRFKVVTDGTSVIQYANQRVSIPYDIIETRTYTID
jgi:predicted secreted protein